MQHGCSVSPTIFADKNKIVKNTRIITRLEVRIPLGDLKVASQSFVHLGQFCAFCLACVFDAISVSICMSWWMINRISFWHQRQHERWCTDTLRGCERTCTLACTGAPAHTRGCSEGLNGCPLGFGVWEWQFARLPWPLCIDWLSGVCAERNLGPKEKRREPFTQHGRAWNNPPVEQAAFWKCLGEEMGLKLTAVSYLSKTSRLFTALSFSSRTSQVFPWMSDDWYLATGTG